jgi:hypothetical protein
MKKGTSAETIESSTVCYYTLEQGARWTIQTQLQALLEEEVTTFLGRVRHERRRTGDPVDLPAGSRNAYGKRRRVSMMGGTLVVRRPRVRDLAERFESEILPLSRGGLRRSARCFQSSIGTGSPRGISSGHTRATR